MTQTVKHLPTTWETWVQCLGREDPLENEMAVSGLQQSDSVTYIHVSILFQILFPFRWLYNIEQRSPCHIAGLY